MDEQKMYYLLSIDQKHCEIVRVSALFVFAKCKCNHQKFPFKFCHRLKETATWKEFRPYW